MRKKKSVEPFIPNWTESFAAEFMISRTYASKSVTGLWLKYKDILKLLGFRIYQTDNWYLEHRNPFYEKKDLCGIRSRRNAAVIKYLQAQI